MDTPLAENHDCQHSLSWKTVLRFTNAILIRLNPWAFSQDSPWRIVWTTVNVLWLIFFAGLVVFPSFFMYPGTDWGAYVGVGKLLSEGYLPYQDVWEFKPPIIFLYTATWCKVFGASWWSVNAALIPIYAGFGLAVYGLYRTLFGRAWSASFAGSLAILFVGRLSMDATRNGSIAVFASAFELTALILFWMAWQSRNTRTTRQVCRYAFFSGALAATAILTRQTSIVVLAIPILWWLVDRTPTATRLVVSFLAGGTAVTLLLCVLALLSGLNVLQAFLASVEFSRVYLGDVSENYTVIAVLANFGKILWSCWTLAIGTLVYALWRPHTSMSDRQKAIFYVLIPLGLSVVLKVLVGRKLIGYYYFPLFGYLAIVVVFTFCLLFQSAFKGKRVAWIACGVMLTVLSYNASQEIKVERNRLNRWQASVRSHQGEHGFGRKRWSWSRHLRGFDKDTMPDIVVSKSVTDLFEKANSRDRTLFTYGSRAWLHVFSDATSPTKYCHSVGFLDPWSLGFPKRTRETIDEFRQAPPQVIVQWFGTRPPAPGSERRPQAVGLAAEFEEKVLSKYELVKEFTFSKEETYPYKSHTALIYQLRESEQVRVARNQK